jgi:glycopeptide antibiotics resistance protein
LTLLGSMDIDDLILNLAGMILGYLAFMFCER